MKKRDKEKGKMKGRIVKDRKLKMNVEGYSRK